MKKLIQKNKFILMIVASLIVVALCALIFTRFFRATNELDSPVVAYVAGQPIRQIELDIELLFAQLTNPNTSTENALREIAARRILLKDAAARGIFVEEDALGNNIIYAREARQRAIDNENLEEQNFFNELDAFIRHLGMTEEEFFAMDAMIDRFSSTWILADYIDALMIENGLCMTKDIDKLDDVLVSHLEALLEEAGFRIID